MILMVDNIDSFVWNLVRYLERCGSEINIVRNDELDFRAIENACYEGIVLSPGPGTPDEAGSLLPLISKFAGRIPILGVCLGHQAIAEVFGATIRTGTAPMHGKISRVHHDGMGIFTGLPSPYNVTRYHSLVVDRSSLPSCLTVSCETDDGTVMGLRHVSALIESVQFHPEAELTEYGLPLLENFINICKRAGKHAASI